MAERPPRDSHFGSPLNYRASNGCGPSYAAWQPTRRSTAGINELFRPLINKATGEIGEGLEHRLVGGERTAHPEHTPAQ